MQQNTISKVDMIKESLRNTYKLNDRKENTIEEVIKNGDRHNFYVKRFFKA